MIPQLCAWCWDEGRLTVVNDATWEQALAAWDDETLSHGICGTHADELRRRHGLTEVTR